MAKHITQKFIPPLIDSQRFNMNGMVPSAAGMKRLAETLNFVTGRCKKQVFAMARALFEIPSGDGPLFFWNGRFRTGPNTTGLRVIMGIALTDYVFSNPPEVLLLVKDVVTDTFVLNPSWTFSGVTADVVPAPNEIHYVHAIAEGLSPNTEYTHYLQVVEGARPLFLSLTECDKNHADDTVDGVCNPAAFVAEGPIYKSHIADLIDANNRAWKHGGAHLISWCPPHEEDSWTALTATSYTNVINNSSTTVTGATPGWNLWTQYHNTINRTTVPVKLCVLVQRVSGTGTLDFRLTDGTNTLGATGASGSGVQWLTVTGNIPAQAGTKWDLHAKVSAGSWRVKAISLFEYEV